MERECYGPPAVPPVVRSRREPAAYRDRFGPWAGASAIVLVLVAAAAASSTLGRAAPIAPPSRALLPGEADSCPETGCASGDRPALAGPFPGANRPDGPDSSAV